MPQRHAVFRKLILEVLAVHTGLDARRERVTVNLEHTMDPAHVEADNHAATAIAWHKAAGDV